MMKKIIFTFMAVLIVFSAIGCQSSTNSKTSDKFDEQTFLNNYNQNVAKIGKQEGLEPFDLLALPEDLNKIGDDGLLHGVNYSELALNISDNEIFIDIFFKNKNNVTEYDEKIVKVALTAAIEAVAPNRSREIERELKIVDDNGNIQLPIESTSNITQKDDLKYFVDISNLDILLVISQNEK